METTIQPKLFSTTNFNLSCFIAFNGIDLDDIIYDQAEGTRCRFIFNIDIGDPELQQYLLKWESSNDLISSLKKILHCSRMLKKELKEFLVSSR